MFSSQNIYNKKKVINHLQNYLLSLLNNYKLKHKSYLCYLKDNDQLSITLILNLEL